MVVRRELSGLPLADDGREVILRITQDDLQRLEKHLFQRYPHREWGSFIRWGYRRTSWGLALSYVDALWPGADDLDRQPALTRFRDQYSRRAFQAAASHPLAVGVVHSHPEGYRTWPSDLDDDMDAYFARELAAYSGGAPYCSLILQRSAASGLTFTARVNDRGEWLPAETIFVVGPVVQRLTSEAAERSQLEGEGAEGESTTARLGSLLGCASEQRLRRAVVGVVGCSGTGSPAVHVLARAGVGGFVLVDPQRFSRSNLERLHGSTWTMGNTPVPPYKAALLRELIASINPQSKVTALRGNVLHDNVLDELLRCDVVLGCTDTQHGRVALSDASQQYLLPSLDLGVLMQGQQGRLTTQLAELTAYSPELPCAFCGGRIDTAVLDVEMMSEQERATRQLAAAAAVARGDNPDQYWRNHDRQLHTVGYLTTAVGALGAGYIEGWLTGAFAMPHSSWQFDMGCERLGVAVARRQRDENCTCRDHRGWSDLARAYRNVALPPHWERRAVLLHRD